MIVYFTSQYARAGDTFIRREVTELRNRGFPVHTFSIRRSKELDVSQEVAEEQARTVYILEQGMLNILLASIAELFSNPFRFLLTLLLALQVRRPGISSFVKHLIYFSEATYFARRLRCLGATHIHNHIAENSATVAMLASKLTRVPYSLTIHGPHEFMIASEIALERKIAGAKFVACISSFCKSQCMLWCDARYWEKLHIVRCGLDQRFLGYPAQPLQNSNPFVCVGRLCAEKGQILLVEALGKLRNEGLSAELVLVGDGPARSSIESVIKRLELSKYVKLVGWQDSETVLEYLQNSRALVLPSFAEGLPVVIMEAFAIRRPVISTFIAGIPELVQNGVNGWLVPAGSIDDLANAMRSVLEAPLFELEKMGERGCDAVRRLHNIQTEIDRLSVLIRANSQSLPCSFPAA